MNNSQPEILLLIAAPGAGKSTYAENFIDKHPDYIRLCADVLRGVIGQDESDQSKNGEVFKNLHIMEEYFCKLQRNIIMDETHYLREYRKFSIGLAKRYGYTIKAIMLTTDLETCLKRNKSRKRFAPEFVIYKFFNLLQNPTLEEGFDQIHYREKFDEV